MVKRWLKKITTMYVYNFLLPRMEWNVSIELVFVLYDSGNVNVCFNAVLKIRMACVNSMKCRLLQANFAQQRIFLTSWEPFSAEQLARLQETWSDLKPF